MYDIHLHTINLRRIIAGFTFVHDGEPDTVSNEYDDLTITVTTIPEPATMALLGLGSIITLRRRRK